MSDFIFEEMISYELWELERKAGVPEAQGVNPYWYG